MPLTDVLILLVAGFWAGAINAIVGSGTLVTFPTLLLLGYPPLVANVSNTLGLVAGGIGGIRGYRDELAGHGPTLRRLLPASVAGAIVGALLLLILPSAAFEAIVPVLIAAALVLVITGPRLNRLFAARHARRSGGLTTGPAAVDGARAGGASGDVGESSEIGSRPDGLPLGAAGIVTLGGIFVAGVYGGYFGAAQGVLLIGVMSALMADPLQRINGFKNVLGTAVNAVAAIVFVLIAWNDIDWTVAAIIAIGALGGGFVGGRLGRRLPPNALRAIIVVIGLVAIAKLVLD